MKRISRSNMISSKQNSQKYSERNKNVSWNRIHLPMVSGKNPWEG